LPAAWVDQFESAASCDMSVAEAEEISGKNILQVEVKNAWITHHIEDGATDVLLGFDGDKLKFLQVTWDIPNKTRTARYQRVDLCDTLPSSPDVVHRMRKR
jgi:hypothetical protein